ncbi:MAG: hypothetical protein PHD11_06190 [Bacteroidales bacterium]|nr:hypothetical protein [Bacteroidales bacterium]
MKSYLLFSKYIIKTFRQSDISRVKRSFVGKSAFTMIRQMEDLIGYGLIIEGLMF